MGYISNYTDSKSIVKKYLLPIVFLLLNPNAFGYKILYAEQYYRLFHRHFYQSPDDSVENIHYLVRALQADFANPLYALARIETREEAERYRYLFKMHVNLKLIKLHLLLGLKYDKMKAYYYNEPWKEDNLKSLEIADEVYRYALHFWERARSWSAKAWKVRNIDLEEIYEWQDENFRIETGDLDYGDIIQAHLKRLNEVKQAFIEMEGF